MLIELNEVRLFILDMQTVGQRIRARINEIGADQADVARATGLSPQRLNNYITGKRPPDIESLVKIAKALRVSTDRLLGLSEALPVDTGAVILRLLELDGMPEARAQVIAEAAAAALQILSSLPAEGDSHSRALIAAQAVWQSKSASKPS